jgi:glycine/D-amino acid oxidase-like deaminating enzyme/nitrite reductase/ring-hydroxylating ferredoxin subunit
MTSGPTDGPHGATPLWLAGADGTPRPALDHDIDVDIVVIGGGIAGVTTALLLQRDGAKVAVLERDHVASGATGYTTAKVSALQQTKLSDIRRIHGASGAAAYATASLAAVERIAAFVDEGVECDWERLPAITYAADATQERAVRDEAAAAEDAGLGVELIDATALPFPAVIGVSLADQGQFDPVRYVRALAERLEAAGGEIFERTLVVKLHEGSPCRVTTSSGAVVRARDVIVCTNYPLLDRGLFFARTEAARSYLIAARLRAPAPRGMFISAGAPTRSMRPCTSSQGEHWILVGGEGHATGSADAQPERYALLEEFARAHFDVVDVPYRWSTQDAMPVDKLPYAGTYTPVSRHLFVNAGGQKWGMTNATIGATIIADRLAGRVHPQAGVFGPSRLSLRAVPALGKAQAHVGVEFVGERLRPADTGTADEIPRGEARVVRSGLLGKTGAYRDEGGGLHAVSVRCTHLGCLLRFNTAERSWDCPCHGSRFDVDGAVLAGPAVAPLEQREPPPTWTPPR